MSLRQARQMVWGVEDHELLGFPAAARNVWTYGVINAQDRGGWCAVERAIRVVSANWPGTRIGLPEQRLRSGPPGWRL